MALIATGANIPAEAPHPIPELEKAILLKTDAQIQALNAQFQLELQKAAEPLKLQLQKAVEPVAKEQQEVLTRVCQSAKLTYGVDCLVDLPAGVVKKKEAPPKAATQ